MDSYSSQDLRFVRFKITARKPLPRMIEKKNLGERLSHFAEKPMRQYENEDEDEEEDYDDVEIGEEEDEEDDLLYDENELDDVDGSLEVESARHDSKLNTTMNLTPPLRTPSQGVQENMFIKKNVSNNYQYSPTKVNGKGGGHTVCKVFIAFIILAIGILYVSKSTAQNTRNQSHIFQHQQSPEVIIKNLEKNIDEISKTFKKQNNQIWDEIIAGVADVIINPNRPAIFFLFSNQDDTMSCLAKMIANASGAALGSDTNLWLSASNMGNDYGDIVYKFKNAIEEKKIVIVDNLLAIDPKAMQAFHHMCDKYDPLVKNAVYILTMVANGYEENKNPMIFVEDQLKHKMKNSIREDKLQPLITRMTDGPIIPVQPEPDIRHCPLRY